MEGGKGIVIYYDFFLMIELKENLFLLILSIGCLKDFSGGLYRSVF